MDSRMWHLFHVIPFHWLIIIKHWSLDSFTNDCNRLQKRKQNDISTIKSSVTNTISSAAFLCLSVWVILGFNSVQFISSNQLFLMVKQMRERERVHLNQFPIWIGGYPITNNKHHNEIVVVKYNKTKE